MKKKILLPLTIALLVAVCIASAKSVISLFDDSSEDIVLNRDSIAIYVNDGDGIYRLSGATIFPKDGYNLNKSKSSCSSGGTITQNPDSKTINFSVSSGVTCNLYFDKAVAISTMLINKANDKSIKTYSGATGEMYTFEHAQTAQTGSLIDYRYIGSSPKNYVTFNGETWRIIGVFSHDGEPRIKLMRGSLLAYLPWNANNMNNWPTATLYTLLNGNYYNRTSTYVNNGLTPTARSQITNSTWHLGSSSSSSISTEEYYRRERSLEKYSSNAEATKAYVGLIYPSDYLYTFANGVDAECFNMGYNCTTDRGGTPTASWIFNSYTFSSYVWTITPSTNYYQSTHISSNGYLAFVTGTLGLSGNRGTIPVVYLRPDITVLAGDGSSSNPYVLDSPDYTITNDDYYFAYNPKTGAYMSNNQRQKSTTAQTTLTFLKSFSRGITLEYSYDSEASWDKLTIIHNENTVVNAVSGLVTQGTYEIPSISAGDTLTFKYAKDNSGDKGADSAAVKIVYN